MYIVNLYNDGITTEIHGERAKLSSGTCVKACDNSISSFTFTMVPSNPGFSLVHDYKTLVTIFNTRRNRFEFHGRVLCSTPEMDSQGRISKEVVCESFFGFFCDSKQKYVVEKNWTVAELWEHIVNTHNEQVEDYKQFAIGEIAVEDSNDNLYLGIQRDNTWQTIKSKLIDTLGGEIRFRVVDGITYVDHLVSVGGLRATQIALSHNMKTIRQENDPTAYISRLIPLGAKLTDEEGNQTEERVDITSVNNGLDYIEDVDAKAAHGIRVEHVYFDNVTDPANLKRKGEEHLQENNRVRVKYSATALDLSLLGLDIDDFEEGDYYPIVNSLLGINDIARITKKNIDVCDETKTTIELGDRFKTLNEIHTQQSNKVVENSISMMEKHFVTNNQLISESRNLASLINQADESILLEISEQYTKKTSLEEYEKYIASQLELLSDRMDYRVTETEKRVSSIDGDLQSKFNLITKYFTFDINGLQIGAVDSDGKESPNKVIIDNDNVTILANGIIVQEFKSDGTALIPILKITQMLDLLGLRTTEDATHINCDYLGGD